MPSGECISATAIVPAAPQSQQRSLELVPAHPDLSGKCSLIQLRPNIHGILVRLPCLCASECGGQDRIRPCQLAGTQAQQHRASVNLIFM